MFLSTGQFLTEKGYVCWYEFFFLLIFCVISVSAQVETDNLDKFLKEWGGKNQKDPRNSPIYLATGAMDLQETSDKTRVWIGTEGVHLWQGEQEQPILEMVCDQAVVWFKPKPREQTSPEEGEEKEKEDAAGLSFSGDQAETAMLYAEGNVHFRWADHYFKGERLFFDFVLNRGIVQQGNMRTQIPIEEDKIVALLIRSQELKIHSSKEITAKQAILSPCQFGHPHYHFSAQEIRVLKFANTIHVSARNNHLEAFGVPFFYIPYITGENFENWPIKAIEYGHSSRWGNYLLSTWGGDVYKAQTEESGLSKVRWLLDADIREKRGFAGGPRLEYSGNFPKESPFSGKLRWYYSYDQPLDELGTKMGHIPDEDEDATWDKRNMVYALHRHRFPNNWFVDAEFSSISDGNFLRDFFEKEFREEKEPETYIYTRKYWDHHVVTGLARWRLNNYQGQIEYLPQGTYQSIFQPVFATSIPNLYWSSRVEISNVRRRDDTSSPTLWDNDRVIRLDWNNTLYYKYHIGSVQFLPFVGGRLSYFDRGEDGEIDLFRRSAEFGMEVATNFYRTYTWKSNFFQIDNILHVFTPHIRYQWIFANSTGSDELIPMDSMEQVDRLQSLEFMLVNRLRTMRNKQISDFFWLEIGLKYFPDRPDNFDSSKLRGDPKWKNFDHLLFDLVWSVRSDCWTRTKFEYNLGVHDFEIFQQSLGYDISSKFSVWMDYRYDRHQNSIATMSAYYRYNEKWAFKTSLQYDWNEKELRECKGVVRRYFHCFALDFTFKYDQVDDNTSFAVQFAPIELITSLKKE